MRNMDKGILTTSLPIVEEEEKKDKAPKAKKPEIKASVPEENK